MSEAVPARAALRPHIQRARVSTTGFNTDSTNASSSSRSHQLLVLKSTAWGCRAVVAVADVVAPLVHPQDRITQFVHEPVPSDTRV